MNLTERQNEILRVLHEKKYMSVEELSENLNVSKVTIRSDLSALEQKGELSRTHGGAMISEVAPRLVSLSLMENSSEKELIGKASAEMIQDNSVVILDSGSTTVRIAEALHGRSLTVVTNSLLVSDVLKAESNIELLMLGGTLRRNILGFTGPVTKLALSQIHADIYFLGGGGFTENSIYCSNLLEAEVKQTMMKSADIVCFVADSSKKDRSLFGLVTSWEEIDYFITDKIDPDFKALLESKGVVVIT